MISPGLFTFIFCLFDSCPISDVVESIAKRIVAITETDRGEVVTVVRRVYISLTGTVS
jgi:hypothetical protein